MFFITKEGTETLRYCFSPSRFRIPLGKVQIHCPHFCFRVGQVLRGPRQQR